jgi:hypothetical protein
MFLTALPNAPTFHYSIIPSFHLITLSACASTFGGIVRPDLFGALEIDDSHTGG